tara:strand:+ start:754 stop:993 length:240 start_codon:yes stop_codon:yes gene_type:complete
MRKPENCTLQYCGYKNPETSDEIEVELLGLNNAIKVAESRISSLIQSRFYAEAYLRSSFNSDEKPKEADDEDCKIEKEI